MPKIAFLPLNVAEPIRPALGRQISHFVCESLKAQPDVEGQYVTYLAQVGTNETSLCEVTAKQKCAKVRFDLIVVEEEPGGKQTEVRVSKRVRIRDSTPATMKLNYKLRKGRKVASHRFEQTGCELCD